MADGFGFRIEGEAQVDAEEVAFSPAQDVTEAPFVAAGLGAGPPETWWGELLEFAAPFLAVAGAAALITALTPDGLSLLTTGWRT